MTPFLKIVAQDLYEKCNGNFSNLTIVFPNKRASLFFDQYLIRLCSKPIWSPRYTTISDLFRRFSSLECCDKILLVCELYKVYVDITLSKETLDQFYAWGEIMLSDFDDIDKHMADAHNIFALLRDIHELDEVDYLTDSQKETLQQFFAGFSMNHTTELKKRFLQLWNKMEDIYTSYRQRLQEKNMAYEGMLYLDAIQHIRSGKFSNTHDDNQTYVFIGFNLLHDVEQSLFAYFQKKGQAKFYWDFDHYYMKNHEAGKYIKHHLSVFPNELLVNHPTYNHFSEEKDITYISSTTEDLQARYISQWLTPERIAAGERTAIVMADENMLETILHCIPQSAGFANITTGYPLDKSNVASFVKQYMAYLESCRPTLRVVSSLLRHPLTQCLSKAAAPICYNLLKNKIFYPTLQDITSTIDEAQGISEGINKDEALTSLFTPLHNAQDCLEMSSRLIQTIKAIALKLNEKDDFTREALYRMHSILVRMSEVIGREENFSSCSSCSDKGHTISNGNLGGSWSLGLYQNLLWQIISSTTIPFHGEPLRGIQVMGVLETRNLDFEHLLILSCNEGKLPAKVSDNSFIPFSIRKAMGLTTVDNKVAIYAYYFHRLIGRATNINIMYNSSTQGSQTGEMSRFMLQLLAESKFKIKRQSLSSGQETIIRHPSSKKKTKAIVDRLLENGHFSPSKCNTYLRCPLMFYYKYVAGIYETDNTEEDTIDAIIMGNIFHKVAESIYAPMQGRTITSEFITKLLEPENSSFIKSLISKAFRTELFHITDDNRPTPRLNGIQAIHYDMVYVFLRNQLSYDLKHTPFTLHSTEREVSQKLPINVSGKTHQITIGGTIDRLDIQTNEEGDRTLLVIDYKTGRKSKKLNIDSIEDIFNSANIDNHSDYFLQCMMYSAILNNKRNGTNIERDFKISPKLYYVQQIKQDKYEPGLFLGKKIITDVNPYSEAYTTCLQKLIEEILDVNIPFTPTPHTSKRCGRCPYASFCF